MSDPAPDDLPDELLAQVLRREQYQFQPNITDSEWLLAREVRRRRDQETAREALIDAADEMRAALNALSVLDPIKNGPVAWRGLQEAAWEIRDKYDALRGGV